MNLYYLFKPSMVDMTYYPIISFFYPYKLVPKRTRLQRYHLYEGHALPEFHLRLLDISAAMIAWCQESLGNRYRFAGAYDRKGVGGYVVIFDTMAELFAFKAMWGEEMVYEKRC